MPISIPYLSLLSKDIYLKLQKDENDKIENVLERSILLTKLWRQIKSVEKIESNDLNPLILKKIYGLSAKCDDGKFQKRAFLTKLRPLSTGPRNLIFRN